VFHWAIHAKIYALSSGSEMVVASLLFHFPGRDAGLVARVSMSSIPAACSSAV
jgi:hypothetical protein